MHVSMYVCMYVCIYDMYYILSSAKPKLTKRSAGQLTGIYGLNHFFLWSFEGISSHRKQVLCCHPVFIMYSDYLIVDRYEIYSIAIKKNQMPYKRLPEKYES